jgi:hypothetical protein
MEISDYYTLYDIRHAHDFKQVTISKYKKKDVINAYQNCMINNKLEDSIRWSTELHCTCITMQIWDVIFHVYTKYIHVNNPRLFFYLLKRQKDYTRTLNTYTNIIFTKNDQEIRNLFCELTSLCVLSNKDNLFLDTSFPKINVKSYQKEEIHKRILSKNLDKIVPFVHNTTSNEVKLALNEMITNLCKKKGTYQNCIYWYLWIEKLEYYHKKDVPYLFEKTDKKKDKIPEDHWIYIIWDIVLSFDLDKKDKKYIHKLHFLYTKDLKKSKINKRKQYFFLSFYIIKHKINWNKKLFQQEHLVIQSTININKFYRIIISNFELSLTEENKQKMRKHYFYLINKKYKVQKVHNINVNEDINRILLTKYPQYQELKTDKKRRSYDDDIDDDNNNDNNNNDNDNDDNIDKRNKENKDFDNDPETNLISKNMTIQDVTKSKEELVNKKMDAFKQFVTYKKALTPQTVMDYYNENKDPIEEEKMTRNIILVKRK